MKDEGFNKGISEATGKAESFASKFASVATGVGKAAAVGLGAAATAFGGLSIKALQLGGELEQNIGGSEAVFKQFAATVQDVGSKAFETMGLSQSDFLATANKMGALMQGSGLDIETSMDLSTQAMQRAADVASIMGLDTSAAMESVAGAAKGNFTMMDNLGVAMNATTIEAYALSKGITTSYSEMDNAQKVGLAMEMFLEKTAYAAGNYAKENETLAGALGTAKAALTNFLDGSGDVDALVNSFSNAAQVIVKNLQEILPRLTETLPQVFQELASIIPPLFDTLLPAIIDGGVALIDGLLTVVSESGPTLINGIIDSLSKNLPGLLKKAEEILSSVAESLINNMDAIMSAGKDIIAFLIEGLTGALPEVIGTGAEILSELASGIADALPELIPIAIDAILTLVETLIDNVDSVIDAAIKIITALAEGLVNALPVLIEKAPTIIAKLVDAIINNAPKLLMAAAEIIIKLATGIIENLPQILKAGTEIILKLVAGVVSFYGKLTSTAKEIVSKVKTTIANTNWLQLGVDIVKGIGNGIKNGASFVVGAMKNLASDALNAAKSALKIQSPSKRFEDEVGAMIALGTAEGIDEKAKEAETAAAKMAKDTFGAAKTWIEDYQNSEDYMVTEELAMWEHLSKTYEKHTKLKVEADKKAAKLREQIGKEGFELSKSWIDKQKFYGQLSAREEVEAWERVTARYVEGTKEREEADRALFTARSKLEKENYDKAVNLMELRKTFGMASIQEEIDFWTEMSAQYAEGTELRKQADESLFESQQRLFEEQEKITEKMAAAEEKYQKAVDSRAQAIFNTFGLFDELKEKEEISSQTLTDNLATQVAAMSEWASDIDTLAAKGIDEGLLQELREMGPSAYAEIDALAGMTDAELTNYAELWKDKHRIAREMAIEELAPLRKETDEEIRGLTDDLNKLADTEFVYAGKNSVDGFIRGIKSGFGDLKSAMEEMARIAIETAENKLKIHSPSKVFENMGINTDKGFIKGVLDMAKQVGDTIDSVFGGLGGDIDYGVNFTTAAMSGINAGNFGTGTSGAAKSESQMSALRPITIHVGSINVSADDFDSASKVIRVFENFSHNRVVFGGLN